MKKNNNNNNTLIIKSGTQEVKNLDKILTTALTADKAANNNFSYLHTHTHTHTHTHYTKRGYLVVILP